MKTVNSTNLFAGDITDIDAKPITIISIRKAWKAPSYTIEFEYEYNNKRVTRVFHSNKKWDVYCKAGA